MRARRSLVAITLAGLIALLGGGCQSYCGSLKTAEEQKACEDQQFQRFQQQLRDSRPAGR